MMEWIRTHSIELLSVTCIFNTIIIVSNTYAIKWNQDMTDRITKILKERLP